MPPSASVLFAFRLHHASWIKNEYCISNLIGTMRNTAAVRVETAATTPASKILTSTPLIVASPSTRASAASKCTCILLSPSTYASATGVAKQRRVRGPTRGKRIRRIIVENKGDKISAYVAPEMKAFCGMNANKVVSERGTQIRWICPIQGFYPSWNNVDSTLKDAIIQAVRSRRNDGKLNRKAVPYGHTTGSRSFATAMTIAADRSGGIGNGGNDDDGNGNEPNNNEGNGKEGRKKLDFCDLYEASHGLRDTNEWIDPKCQEKDVMIGEMRDAAALSGTPLSAEEISIKCLGESKMKNYIRGFGNGPKPSTYLSKSNSLSARQDQLQKLQRELDLFREEQRREREEEKTRREEEQKQREEEREEEKRRWEETQRRQDEKRSILLKEMDVFKSFMSQLQNGGRGNMGAG